MSLRVIDLIQPYQQSTDQTRGLYDQTAAAATTHRAPPLVTAALAVALPVVEVAETLQLRYDGQRNRQVEDEEAFELDRQIGRRITAVHRTLKLVRADGVGTDKGHRAAEILDRIFPKGARAYTHIDFQEQGPATARLVGLLRDERVAPFLARLDLTDTVKEIETLNKRFVEVTRPRSPVTVEELAAAKEAALDAVLAVVMAAMVSAREDGSTDFREPVVRPYLELDAELAAEHRARHARPVAPATVITPPTAPVPATGLVASAK